MSVRTCGYSHSDDPCSRHEGGVGGFDYPSEGSVRLWRRASAALIEISLRSSASTIPRRSLSPASQRLADGSTKDVDSAVSAVVCIALARRSAISPTPGVMRTSNIGMGPDAAMLRRQRIGGRSRAVRDGQR